MQAPSISLSQISSQLSKLIHRFHVIIFSLVVVGGLIVATFLLYKSITATSATADPVSSSSAFDKKTIEKIQGLRDPDEASEPLKLPPGRINPFQ